MSNLTGLISITHLQRWIRIMAKRAGLSVSFDDDIPTAYATRTSVHIPTLNDKITKDDESVLRWQLVHELLGHHNHGFEMFDYLDRAKIPQDHPFGHILNIVEDQRIEAAIADGYDGDAMIISDGREVSGRRTLAKFKDVASTVGHDGLDEDSAKMQAAYLCASKAQATWCPGVKLHLSDELRQCDAHFPSVISNLDKLVDAGCVNEIVTLDTCEDAINTAAKIYGILWGKDEEEVKKELQEMQSKQGTGEGEGDGKSGKTPGADKLGKDGKPAEGVDPRTGKYRLPFEFFVKSNHGNDGEHITGHGLGLDYTNYRGHDVFVPCPPNEFSIHDHYREGAAGYRGGTLSRFGGALKSLSTSSAFANRMRRYLQVMAEDTYEGGKKRGILNSRSLYKAGLPVVGDGDWNRKVFKHKNESNMLDTSVTLLTDLSGSMSGPKVVHATHACMMLNHVISNTLRVNTEILGFTWDHSCVMHIIKPFNVRMPDDKIYHHFDVASDRMMGNGDADAILFALERLTQQQTKRKVLIVLSDGSPADGWGDTDPYYALKETVKQIEASKRIDIIGIGIMDRSVKEFYRKHTIINRAEELEDGLIRVISSHILKG
jgi:hypothetical protein